MKIVTAQNLQSWADTLNARADLPGVVASLIRASCPSLKSFRFPNGDASQAHGFDGIAEAVDSSVFVPEGRSIWEFGAGKDYKTKAGGDYRKRTRQLSRKERSKHTFIFVTPRIWDTPGKDAKAQKVTRTSARKVSSRARPKKKARATQSREDWIRQRSADGWLDVQVLDAVMLEHWLDECPTVALPLARELGIIPASGVRTVQDFWDEFRLSFIPTVKEELLLNGRHERAKRLCDALAAGLPDLSKWQADSPKEAAAFIAAAIMRADPEQSRFLSSKTLFLDTIAAAQTVPTKNRFNFILLPEASSMGPALARNNQVILVLGSDDRAADSELLERMKTPEFAAGLKSMGFTDEDAYQLAVTSGRSLTVLARMKPSALVVLPKWHTDPKLVPMFLAGGWDASNKHDRDVVAKLCNLSYPKIDSEARRLASHADAPLDLQGSVWTLRSPFDAFSLLARLVDTRTQERFRTACISVFSERDRRLDRPDEVGSLIPTRGDDFLHSEWLRRGLARTLLLISGLHEAAHFTVIGRTPEQYVDGIVAALPDLAEDIRALASLKSEFPRLAEAAPHPLASALEQVLEGDGKEWSSVVFRDVKDAPFWHASSPHTYMLWALETMAWSPKYLRHATSILMTLAEFDPGGKLANRPLNSLREIFLAWRPNTNASLDERIAVLRSICRERPTVGFELAISLLPRGHDNSGGTAKPWLRDFGDAKSKATTWADANRAFQQYAQISVDLAATDIARLTKLVDSLSQLDETTRTRVNLAIRQSAVNASPDAVFELWSKLNDFVERHRQYQDADWAMKPEQLRPIEEVRDAIRPTDPVRQILWLFNDFVPKPRDWKGTDYIKKANRDRTEALRGLLEEKGVSAVLDLARAAKHPQLVGVALGQSGESIEILKEALSLAIQPKSDIPPAFATALSSVAHDVHGGPWDTWIAEIVGRLEPRAAADLVSYWTDSRLTWDFVATLSRDIQREYWTWKPVSRPDLQKDFEWSFGKYVEVGRFTAILDMVGYRENVLSTPQCVQVLQGLLGELSKDTRKMQAAQYEVVHMIQALQQREDVDIVQLATLEYHYLPMLEFQAEPIALNKLLGTSPEFFISIIRDAFAAATEKREEISEERRMRARLAYRVLQSIKKPPGFSSGEADVDHLRSWISEVRRLAKEDDRVVITDEQIGQILAYAPVDAGDAAWPVKPIRDVIEELGAEAIERGIALSRFNQRGTFKKSLYDGGQQERGLATQYRSWAEVVRSWPRTSALLQRIADDWDYHARRADTEAELDQLRDG